MNMPIAERKQIENEMIFRRGNEKVGDDLGALDAMHIEDNNPHYINEDMVLHFKCECSDENCSERIPVMLSLYQQIHEDRNSFIVKLDHQVDKIEKVISKTSDYCVVMKNNSTAEPGSLLNTTPINNG